MAPPYAYVQRAVGAALNGTPAAVLTANTTVGNVLICTMTGGAGSSPTSLTDSKSNTWRLCTRNALNRAIAVFYTVLTTALVNGDTITPNAIGSTPLCIVDEYAGLMGTIPFDVANVGNDAGAPTTLASGSSGTLIQANELVYSVIAINGSATPVTVPTGYTDRGNVVSGGITLDGAELVVNSTAAQNPSWTWTGATNASAAVVTFGRANVAAWRNSGTRPAPFKPGLAR